MSLSVGAAMETDLRPIPKRLLCPVDRGGCGKGRMKPSDVDGGQVKLGDYKRSAQYTCDRCDYTERRYEDFVGVVDDQPTTDRYPDQPSLFD